VNLLVSDTIAYSKAMIRWLRLSPDEWHPVAYGDHVPGVYADAKIVRPAGDVEEWHVDWFLSRVVTSVLEKVSTFPESWDLSSVQSST